MPDRTTITVSTETKSLLNDHRGGAKWDRFLKSLIQPNSSGDSVVVAEKSVDDIAARTAKKTVEEMRTELR